MLLAGDARVAERTLLQAVGKPPVEPAAFRYLADAAERLGHIPVARDALLRYVALAGESDVDQAIAARLTRLSRATGRGATVR